jgi:Na+-transporting NADH:ubiquinone oxidoreductase subunit B
MLNGFLLASFPALLLSLWSIGLIKPGLSLFIPRLAIAILTSLVWVFLFARLRDRQPDPGWLYCAWIFTLLMPAAIPLPLIIIGLSFGLVFGSLVFGGTGRYFVNPALLGAAFLLLAYPALMNGHWLPAGDAASTWSVASGQGTAVLSETGVRWLDVAIGREVAALGVPAAGACLAGALFLILIGLASWRIVIGGLLGMVAVSVGFDSIAWHWQPMLGNFAFALAFIATDPTTTPASRGGRWILGLTFGAVTVVIRMLNPEHPEGTVFALLLASSLAPLADHLAAPKTPVVEAD